MPTTTPSRPVRVLPALLAAALLTAAGAPAQVRVEVRPPVAAGALVRAEPTNPEDPGRPVQMLESPNIDRFLRRAQDFLARDDFRGTITILQDVVEGRTLQEVGADGETGTEPVQDPALADDSFWGDLVESSENAVFSNDERLYRPVRRLCHELLASLPPEGLTLYRSRFEVAAERALADAAGTGEVHRFDEVFQRWFMTLTAARAMAAAGDLRMDQGTFRAAIQTFRLLLEVYPSDSRARAGISDAWIHFKIALCFQLLGEPARAGEELNRLAELHADASLRIQGELVPVRELPARDLFRDATMTVDRERTAGIRALGGGEARLVSLWEHRFADQRPYRSPRATSSRNQGWVVTQDGAAMSGAPKFNDYKPGTSVWFLGGTVAFLDHFQLNVREALSGLLIARNDGKENETSEPRSGQPRTRYPAYDFASHRVAHDDDRMYIVVGPSLSRLTGMKPVLQNRLEAWSRQDGTLAWQTKELPSYKGVTFLATPTVFGARLLVPIARRGTFGLLCCDSATGEPHFLVPIHRDGTPMARPPASPVVVEAGIAYVLTNAGCLAAIDAFTGTLRWIRRYERSHPYRPSRRRPSKRRNTNMFVGAAFQEISLYGFAPSELLVGDGLVILAPCDGRVMHCLDGATGDPVWMLSRHELEYLIGHDGEYIYAGGGDQVFSIGLRSGLRYWTEEVPGLGAGAGWRGRGVVAGDRLLIPGDRAIHVRPLQGETDWQTLELSSFSYGTEPLSGPFNLYADGPFLAAVYAGGIEMYSTVEALRSLAAKAEDPMQRATYQIQAGELVTAIETLETIDTSINPALDDRVARRMLTLCSEIALAMASHGARDDALAILTRCRDRLKDVRLEQSWHLARLEVFKALGDLASVEAEQEALYALMGKKE